MIAFLGVAYRRALGLPFLNDDYFFLDKVRNLAFPDLWKPDQLIFGWYRPVSREVHYWLLLHSAGLNPAPYHVVSFAIWIAVMLLYALLVDRLAGSVAAAIATAGVSALALWGAPLLWIAGAQDLWMLLFAMLFLHAIARGWRLAAIPALALALLSKETAAVLPGVATALLWIVDRRTLSDAVRRTIPLWILTAAWVALHPTLDSRLLGNQKYSLETEHRITPQATLAKTLLAQLNLDDRPVPEEGWKSIVVAGVLGSAILGSLVAVALARRKHEAEPTPEPGRGRRAIAFGALWAVMGWTVLFLPSIGWHAYYGCVGTFGCWLAISTWLGRFPRWAIPLVVALALIGAARADTRSWDWGSSWYQKRAGSFLGAVHDRLFELHPIVPPHSRLFFAHIPNNIGLLAGDGPAIRVWYDDPTLKSKFYSEYTPRESGEAAGCDYFFRFDTTRGLVEVETETSTASAARLRDPSWQHDQRALASLFMQSGDVRKAAVTYSRLWRAFPGRRNYALYAATAFEAVSDSFEANAYYRIASRFYGDSMVRERSGALVRTAREYVIAGTRRAR